MESPTQRHPSKDTNRKIPLVCFWVWTATILGRSMSHGWTQIDRAHPVDVWDTPEEAWMGGVAKSWFVSWGDSTDVSSEIRGKSSQCKVMASCLNGSEIVCQVTAALNLFI